MFSQFFSQLGRTESLILIMLLVVAFLLGTLLAYVLNGNRIKALQNKLQQSDSARSRLADQLEALQESREMMEQKLSAHDEEIAERQKKIEETQEKYEVLKSRFKLMFETLHQANSSIRGYLGTIEDLDAQLKAMPAGGGPPAVPAEDAAADAPPAGGNGKSGRILQRILKLEHQLHGLEQLNKQIAASVSQISSPAPTGLSEYHAGEEPAALSSPKSAADFGLEPADDLTRIKGIGPVLQKKLNDRGIRTFRQMATFDHKLIEQLTRELDHFPGRIEEDDWVGQAKALLMEKGSPGHGLEPSNELTLFVGISPKVQEVLQQHGIRGWKALAEASVGDLQAWMKEAELDLDETLVNTWPTQARFAENNQWELLEEYRSRIQDKINP